MATKRKSGLVGRALTALCGGALGINLLLMLGLLGILLFEGAAYFWPRPLVHCVLDDGRQLLGEFMERRPLRRPDGRIADNNSEYELKFRVGNRDQEFGGKDFEWIPERRIRTQSAPEDVVLLERRQWGPFFGRVTKLSHGNEVVAEGAEDLALRVPELMARKSAESDRIRRIEKDELGPLSASLESLRLTQRKRELQGKSTDPGSPEVLEIATELNRLEARSREVMSQLDELRRLEIAETLLLETVSGQTKELPVAEVVRYLRPNSMSWMDKFGLYLSRLWEFVSGEPRESNTEGGIFPAIFGTVLMVFLMSLAVVPLGVLAALYLREYAKQGVIVRMVRIAVNNLAGTPSIVFGVFGLGFFVYLVGGSLDAWLYPERTTATLGTGGVLWAALTLALLTVPVVIVATEEGLAAVPRMVREGSLALGATKWETIKKVVLPASTPAILTGMILAMGRAAGEVAPLMIVGMVKHARDLPIDGTWPFLHFERKFMHVGFHIYDVGLQSPNVEATKPLVAATALLLIAVVTLMNLVAIKVRNRLRQSYANSGV